MGKYSKQASSKQMEAFSKVFENSLLDTYASTLVEFKDEKINDKSDKVQSEAN